MLKEKMLKEMMMMMMISLFFIPLLLHLLPTYTTAQPMSSFIYQSCNNDFGNYTAASTYRRNLNNLLTSLAAADNRTSNSGFYNASSGQSPDRVNAVGLCRGDVAPADCRECITDATGRILAGCPNQKEAVVWFDYCMVRYSNRSVYGVLDPNPVTIYMWNVANASDPVQFSAAVGNLLARLRTSASSGEERFATGTAREGNLTIYGLVQCSPDLSGGNCGVCLADAISQISRCCGRRLGGRVINTNCNFRFETYRFYAATTEAPPPGVMPPSSPPPLVSPPPPPPPSIEGNGRRRNPSRIVAIVAPVVAAVAVLGFIFFLLCRRRKVKRSGIATQTEDEISKDDGSLQFDFDTIRAATNGFADESKLGEGGFGAVYKGTLSNGEEIAVKRLAKDSGQGHSEFKNEVKLVAKLQHRNLVRLLGFCLEGRERLLIYEFVPNASLDHFLFNEDRRGQLDWGRRYRIIRGIARGLIYLHVDSRLRIIHRDLKASNILLDADMNPKISDFGMARLFDIDETQGNTSKIVGTYGYMAPEYAMHGLLSMKSDVFSFGVLVLEIVSGQMNYGFRHDSSTEDLLSFAWKNWKAGTYSNVVDPSLGNVSSDEIANCVHIGLLCVQDNVDDRPTMASVALMLAGNSVSLQQPSRPAFFIFTAGERGSSWGFDKYLDKDDVSSPSTEAIGLSTNDVSVSELYPR